jgi:hypothetical protein
MNLYGFANGDPINFSDPFGLCPPEDTDLSDCSTATEEDRELLRAYAVVKKNGGGEYLQTLVDNNVSVTVTSAQSLVSACGQTRGCFTRNGILLATSADHAETGVRLVHESEHVRLGLCYQREEVLAWKAALDFYQGLGRNVPFYQPSLQSRNANSAGFYSGLRQRAGQGRAPC